MSDRSLENFVITIIGMCVVVKTHMNNIRMTSQCGLGCGKRHLQSSLSGGGDGDLATGFGGDGFLTQRRCTIWYKEGALQAVAVALLQRSVFGPHSVRHTCE